MISRRRFLGIAGGAFATGTGLTGVGLELAPPDDVDTGNGPAARQHGGTSVTDLRGPDTPARGGTVRRHALTARRATVELPSGTRVDAWTYNGRVPGPTITARQGDLVQVRLRNADITDGVTLHWHGYDLPNREDGAPGATQDAVEPGSEFVYRFRADQVGTFWYHTHQVSHIGVRRGLYGPLVVTPRGVANDGGVDLTLPVHTFDGATVLGTHDRPFGRRVAPGTPVRLRLINTDSTPRRLALAGTPSRVVAVDGRELHEPGRLTETALRIAAGSRYDVTFTMPEDPVVLLGDNDATIRLRLAPPGRDEPGVPATADWPELDPLGYGTPEPTPFDRHDQFDRDFTLVLDRGVAFVEGTPQYAHTVNGRGFPSIPTQLVREGDLVRITVVNRGLETHPWHLHGHGVLILSRNGQAPSGSPLWVDTFDVRPGEVWQVGFRANNPGVWMNHCHNLPHAHEGMMLQLAYDGITSPFHH